MPIKDIKDQRRVKELRDRYEKERQVIQIEIDKLQAQLDVLDAYLGDNLNNEWHSKPPLSNDKIAEIYKDFMATYDPNDYTDKD
tara:strand:+ start:242 stop:493 length:252 start_codon:yes stop_codon:yes gene_type:complete